MAENNENNKDSQKGQVTPKKIFKIKKKVEMSKVIIHLNEEGMRFFFSVCRDKLNLRLTDLQEKTFVTSFCRCCCCCCCCCGCCCCCCSAKVAFVDIFP